MNIFESVKAAVTVGQAAERYGLHSTRNGMARCPFHEDRHPSLKLNADYFYCFGCGATGDVVSFTARLFDLGSYEAARKLAADFGVTAVRPPGSSTAEWNKFKRAQVIRQQEDLCFCVLTEYLWLLRDQKAAYAPKHPEDVWDDRFVEACQKLDYVEYLLDEMDDLTQRPGVVEMLTADGKLDALRRRLERNREGEQTHERHITLS